jgi:hypothetical protein
MIGKSFFTRLGGLAVAMLLAATAGGQNRPAAPSNPLPTANAGAPTVAEQAGRLLKEMGADIGTGGQFTFHADITFDNVLPSGQKLQFSAAEEVALQRPYRVIESGSRRLV